MPLILGTPLSQDHETSYFNFYIKIIPLIIHLITPLQNGWSPRLCSLSQSSKWVISSNTHLRFLTTPKDHSNQRILTVSISRPELVPSHENGTTLNNNNGVHLEREKNVQDPLRVCHHPKRPKDHLLIKCKFSPVTT